MSPAPPRNFSTVRFVFAGCYNAGRRMRHQSKSAAIVCEENARIVLGIYRSRRFRFQNVSTNTYGLRRRRLGYDVGFASSSSVACVAVTGREDDKTSPVAAAGADYGTFPRARGDTGRRWHNSSAPRTIRTSRRLAPSNGIYDRDPSCRLARTVVYRRRNARASLCRVRRRVHTM